MYMKLSRLVLITSVSTLLLGGCDFSSLPVGAKTLKISNAPTKTEYIVGELFDPEGMQVVLNSLFESETITEYTYEPSGALTLEDEYVVIKYEEYSAETPIIVKEFEEKTLSNIEITSQPTKLIYTEGESFNPEGMVISAVYSNGEKIEITDYSISLSGALTTSDSEVIISYQDKFVPVSILVQPKVGPILQSIYIKTQPTKTTYTEGEYFNKDGIVVMGRYSDGSESQITSFIFSPSGALTTANTIVTISCGSFTASVSITVNEKQGEFTGYYAGINPNSSTLLKDLNSLNSKKRKSTVGYSNMPSKYPITDKGNGGAVMAFYAGTSDSYSGKMNREHVWPKSLGGSSVENDIHMPRPTYSADNSSRGNEYYVEGRHGPSKPYKETGWDPGAFSNQDETYRGDSARIVFYCAIANTNLKLVDTDGSSKPSNTMGKLSDLISWNLRYPVKQREMDRNNAIENIQGNRNPFIDHPELVCKIWGNYNSTTKSLCGGH